MDSLDRLTEWMIRIVECGNDVLPLLKAQSQRTLQILLKRVKKARKLGIISDETYKILTLLISRQIIN
jgi:hypothetical protein